MAINRYNWAFDNGEKIPEGGEGTKFLDFFKPLEKKGYLFMIHFVVTLNIQLFL